jgi:hypothetical protein
LRRFLLRAVVSDSASSTLAEGVQFSDGCVVLRWVVAAAYPHTVVYDQGITYIEALYGAGSVEWLDAPARPARAGSVASR